MEKQEEGIPEFRSVHEEQEFWDKHSAADSVDEAATVDLDASKAREKRSRAAAERGTHKRKHRQAES